MFVGFFEEKKGFITSSQGCFGVGHEKIVKNINFSFCGKQYYKAFPKCTFFGLLAHYDGWTENSLPHSFYGFFNICSKSTGIIFNIWGRWCFVCDMWIYCLIRKRFTRKTSVNIIIRFITHFSKIDSGILVEYYGTLLLLLLYLWGKSVPTKDPKDFSHVNHTKMKYNWIGRSHLWNGIVIVWRNYASL